MAPTFCCGGACGVTGSGTHWTSKDSNCTFDTVVVRTSGHSMKVAASGTTGQFTTTTVFTGGAGLKNVFRVYVYFDSFPSSDINFAAPNASGHGARFVAAESKVYARANSTQGPTGVSITTGTWHRIDCLMDQTFNGNAGIAVDVQVNGVACGQATNNTVGAFGNGLVLGVAPAATCTVYFADLLVSQTGTDYPLGAGHVSALIPASDGTHNIAGAADFRRTLTATDILNSTTDAYLLIRDIPLPTTAVDWQNMVAPPNITDYVECQFGYAPGFATEAALPRVVSAIAAYHQAGTGTGTMGIAVFAAGTALINVYRANAVAGVTAIAYANKSTNVISGATGGPDTWTVRFGTDPFSGTNAVDANPDQYFDAIILEAEFAEAKSLVPALPSNYGPKWFPPRKRYL